MFRTFIVILVVLLPIAGCQGKTKEELYGTGLAQMKEGNPNGAIVLFKNALEKDQNYTDARFQLGRAYTATGKYEQAEKEFRKVSRQDPSRGEIRLELAKLYNFTNKPDMALTEAQDYLTSHPDNAEALEVMGIGYTLKGRLDDAERCFLKVLGTDKGMVSAKLELAGVYARKGNSRDARALLDEVIAGNHKDTRAYFMLATLEATLGNRDKALQAYRTIAEINPSDVTALYRSGIIYIDKKEMDKAEKTAGDLMQKFPKRPEGHRLMGLVHYYKRNFNEAVTALLNSLKIQQNLGAYYFLGLSHYNRGELELALSQFRKILDVNPSFTQARLLNGIILLKQKRVDDSITEIQKVLRQDDKNALAHNLLGSAYMAKGMFDEGMKELNAATAIDPKLIDAHLKKGAFKLAKGKAQEAEADLQAAVQVFPELLNTRLVLASYHMRQKNYVKAVNVLNAGMSGKKSDALLYNAMAAVSFAEKREVDAIKYLQKSKEADPGYLAPCFNLASYYTARNEAGKALAEYREVLKRDPQNVPALLGMAATLEAKGESGEALTFYLKAKETKQGAGYLALANHYVRKKETTRAVDVLDEAIKVDSRNAAAVELKGGIQIKEKMYKEAVRTFEHLEAADPNRGLTLIAATYVMMKDFPKAVEAARKIIKNRPDSAYGYSILASVYEGQHDTEKAVDALKTGVKTDGKDLDVRMRLGDLYAKKKDFPSALSVYEEIVKRAPAYLPAVFAQSTVYDRMGRKEDAARKYREVLGKSENHMLALNNLAYLYANGHGSKKEALRLATRAYRLAPNNASVMDTMGFVLLKNGKIEEACKLLEKAANLIPKNPSVHYHLGLACLEQGDRARAVQSIQKSLDLGEFSEVDSAKILLAGLKKESRGR